MRLANSCVECDRDRGKAILTNGHGHRLEPRESSVRGLKAITARPQSNQEVTVSTAAEARNAIGPASRVDGESGLVGPHA